MKDVTETGPKRRQFGRYQVLEVIGEGAMAVVFLAEDPVIGRKVAVKVLQPQKGLSDREAEELRSRFEREFQAAGKLAHPHLVTIHDVGREGGASFIAMEYVDGGNLRTLLARGQRLPQPRVVALLKQVAQGLDFAHGHGIIHRDVKPANVLLTRDGIAKIADFGVAKVSSVELTRTGIILGTPAYMSPEQVTDQNLTPAADQFSLAVLAYQMVTGKRPFGGENATKTLYQIAYHEPTLPSQVNRELPEAADRVLKKAMAKKPQDRFPSCRSFVAALAESLALEATVGGMAVSEESSLATRRMEAVLPQEQKLSHLETTLPESQPAEAAHSSLMDSLLQDDDTGLFSGPPPISSGAPPSSQESSPLELKPLEPPVAPFETAAKEAGAKIGLAESPGPSPPGPGKSDAPPALDDARLELVPLAEEIGAREEDLFGGAKGGVKVWLWQGVGALIAFLVGVAVWLFWAPA